MHLISHSHVQSRLKKISHISHMQATAYTNITMCCQNTCFNISCKYMFQKKLKVLHLFTFTSLFCEVCSTASIFSLYTWIPESHFTPWYAFRSETKVRSCVTSLYVAMPWNGQAVYKSYNYGPSSRPADQRLVEVEEMIKQTRQAICSSVVLCALSSTFQ